MNITIRPSVESAIRAAKLTPVIVAGLVEQWLMASGIDYADVAPVYSPAGGGLAGATASVRHPSLRGDHMHAVNDYILGRIAEAAQAVKQLNGSKDAA
jgi:hypothetical protein